MNSESLIEAFFDQEVEIRPYERMGAGKPIYGPTETRACRIEFGHHLMTTYKHPSGQIDQVEARALMFCTGEIIPDGSIATHGGHDYTVVSCDPMMGFSQSHLEVYLM